MSIDQKFKFLAVASLFSALSAGSIAVAAPSPQAISMGPGKLIPRLAITEKYNDNIFSQNDGFVVNPPEGSDLPAIKVKAKSSMITQLEPLIQFLMENDQYNIALTYTGDYGFYSSSSDDNYNDHTFSVDAFFQPADIYSLRFGASAGMLHDNRGQGASQGLFAGTRNAPDEYDINNANMLLDFGRDSAKYGAEVELSQTAISYTTNRVNTRFRDRRQTFVAGRLYGKFGGKSRYFVEVSNQDYRYTSDPLIGFSIDSVQKVVSVGMTWEATGKTTGTVKIGRLDKDFDQTNTQDDTITVWDVSVTWAPRTYSKVDFLFSKNARETDGFGAFIEVQDFNVSWVHGFSERLSSNVYVGIGTDDYPGSIREDDRTNYGLGLNYDWKRWLNVAALYSYTDRDANLDSFDFETNLFSVTFDMTL